MSEPIRDPLSDDGAPPQRDDPRSAGQASRGLTDANADAALAPLDAARFAFMQGADVLATSDAFPDATARDAALQRARAALASLREAQESLP